MRLVILAMVLGVLLGCAPQRGGNFVGANLAADVGELPENYREVVETHLKGELKDPYSAQIQVSDAVQSSCNIGIYGKFYGWRIPVTYNAKNAYGAYVGSRTVHYWMNGKRIKRISESSSFCP